MAKSSESSSSASQRIDHQIAELNGWRGRMMARLRTVINKADPKLPRRIQMEHRRLERGK